MSNVLYEDKYFNESQKLQFLASMKIGSTKIYQRLFKVAQPLEAQLNKDLAEFNLDELSKYLYLLRPSTKGSSAGNVGYIHKYLDEYTEGINPLDLVDAEWKRQFAIQGTKQFWTDKEFSEIVDSRHNAQDAVILQLLFEGVRGAGNSEITHLTKDAVDAFNKRLHLIDEDGNKRTVAASDKLIKLCEQAIRESEYEKMNGNVSNDIKSPIAQLTDNEFVIRLAKTRVKDESIEADKNVVHRRLKKIAEEIGEPSFSAPLTIIRSGMLAMAKDRYIKNSELTDIDIIEVAIQFGENSDSSVYRLKSDHVNEDTIKQVYNLP